MRHFFVIALATTAACWSGNAAPPAKTPAPAPAPPATVDLAHKTYKHNFEEVWAATVDATRAKYPNLEDNAQTRKLTTAWHAIAGAPAGKRYFARLDVTVAGPPWSIDIVGHVSEWRAGDALPKELTGPELAMVEPAIAEVRDAIDRTLTARR